MKLVAKTNDVTPIEYNEVSWNWLLKHVGLAICAGLNVSGALGRKLYYQKAKDELQEGENENATPYEGKGYFVNAKEAEIMSYLAENLIFLEKGRQEEFQKFSIEKQEELNEEYLLLQGNIRLPAQDYLIEDAKTFSIFARKSGGFYIL